MWRTLVHSPSEFRNALDAAKPALAKSIMIDISDIFENHNCGIEYNFVIPIVPMAGFNLDGESRYAHMVHAFAPHTLECDWHHRPALRVAWNAKRGDIRPQ